MVDIGEVPMKGSRPLSRSFVLGLLTSVTHDTTSVSVTDSCARAQVVKKIWVLNGLDADHERRGSSAAAVAAS